MPIYEYICQNCNRKVSIFLKISDATSNPACPSCGKSGLTRVISSFAIHKSVGTIHEESGDPGPFQSRDYYRDPRNIGRHLEKKFKDMNIEMPSEIQQSISEAREGALPESLKDLDSGASSDSAYH
jgi:putative FmdB family regulatory protein